MEQADVEKLIGDLEIAVDRLRSLYEQYFMGIERLEPTVPRKDVDRRIHFLRKEQVRNTALRFRFQMLVQRYNTYQTHWQRICRDIENGTYKRHVIRAQRRFGLKRDSAPSPPAAKHVNESLAAELAELDREFAPAETLDDTDVELEEEMPPATRRGPANWRSPVPLASPGSVAAPPSPRAPPGPARSAAATQPDTPRNAPRAPTRAPGRKTPLPPTPRADARQVPAPPSSRGPSATSPPRSPGPSGPARPAFSAATPRPAPPPRRREGDVPEERVRQLYSQYIEAKRRQNESTAAITYDAVARSLRESSAKLQNRHGKPVDFEVTIKDGRAIIRPVLK